MRANSSGSFFIPVVVYVLNVVVIFEHIKKTLHLVFRLVAVYGCVGGGDLFFLGGDESVVFIPEKIACRSEIFVGSGIYFVNASELP